MNGPTVLNIVLIALCVFLVMEIFLSTFGRRAEHRKLSDEISQARDEIRRLTLQLAVEERSRALLFSSLTLAHEAHQTAARVSA
jgi:hypothetical protein